MLNVKILYTAFLFTVIFQVPLPPKLLVTRNMDKQQDVDATNRWMMPFLDPIFFGIPPPSSVKSLRFDGDVFCGVFSYKDVLAMFQPTFAKCRVTLCGIPWIPQNNSTRICMCFILQSCSVSSWWHLCNNRTTGAQVFCFWFIDWNVNLMTNRKTYRMIICVYK